jgi:hypothetical protein
LIQSHGKVLSGVEKVISYVAGSHVVGYVTPRRPTNESEFGVRSSNCPAVWATAGWDAVYPIVCAPRSAIRVNERMTAYRDWKYIFFMMAIPF